MSTDMSGVTIRRTDKSYVRPLFTKEAGLELWPFLPKEVGLKLWHFISQSSWTRVIALHTREAGQELWPFVYQRSRTRVMIL